MTSRYIRKRNYIKRLKRIGTSFLKKHEYKNGLNTIHYHLTNEAGIKGIIEKDKFILSDFKNSNDEKEFTFFKEIIFEKLSSLKTPRNERMIDSFLGNYEKYLSTTQLFTASFCGNYLNPTLWSRYGDNGHGYALGFSKGLFEYRRRKCTVPDKDIVPVEVKYGKDNAIRDIKHFVRVYSEILKDIQNNDKDNEIGTLFARTLYAAMPAYKDLQWTDENEHRFYIMNKYPSDKIEVDKLDPPRPYIDNIVTDYLSEIVIGKVANLDENNIRDLLPNKCENIQIKMMD